MRGGSGTLSYSTAVWDRNLESSLTVVAARGSLRIAGQYMDKVEYCHLQDYAMPDAAPHQPRQRTTAPSKARPPTTCR